MDGTVKRVGAGYELRFVRELAHPIEKVWAALTDSHRIGGWLSTGGVVEPRLGGRVHLPGPDIESNVTAFEEGKMITYGWKTADWDGGEVRWEVDATDDGTRLVLTHVFDAMSDEEAEDFRNKLDLPEGWEPVPSTLAGWHAILDNLSEALDGRPADLSLMEAWQDRNERYKKKLAQTTS